MPWNGSGVAQRVHNWTQDKINKIKILASRFDQENDDFASMITNTLTKDGQNSPIADLPMGGQKHTGVGDADARDNYLPVGQYQDGFAVWGVDAGTANAIEALLSPAITGYGTGGLTVRIKKSASDNTGATTVNLNLLGVKSIKMPDGSDPPAGALPASSIMEMTYDGTNFILLTVLTQSLSRAARSGLVISNDVDAAHDISAAAGSARDTGNSFDFSLSAALVKQIDANWAAGTAAGGFPSALTLAADTWYHFFLVDDGSGGTDAGFDTSLTATNLLSDSGGSKYRRIGSVKTDGSLNIRAFYQNGFEFLWVTPPLDINVVNQGAASVTRVLSTPLGIRTKAMLRFFVTGATDPLALVRSLDTADQAVSTTASPLFDAGINGGNLGNQTTDNLGVWTDDSSQVATRASVSSTTIRIVTLGWIDNLGRFD